jgi:hypothetical protein
MPTFAKTVLFQPVGRILVYIERAQIRVQPVGTATFLGRTRTRNQRQIRWRRPKPLFLLVWASCDPHQLACLDSGEHQIVLDLLFGQAKLGQAIVADIARAMAVQTVVDKGPGTALQRRLVALHVRRFVEVEACAAGKGDGRGKEQCRKQFFHGVQSYYIVTRSGSGLYLSIFDHQGMVRKNRK